MKKSIAPLFIMLLCIISIGLAEATAQVRNTVEVEVHSHNIKVATTFETPGHTKRIITHNAGRWSTLYMLYRFRDGDLLWECVGVVTIPGMTKGVFFVQDGYNYGFEIEGEEPDALGGRGKKYKVKDKDRLSKYR